MHVTHLDDQIIATRGVLRPAIPTQGVAKPHPCERRAWPPILPTALLSRLLAGNGEPDIPVGL